MRRPRPRVGSLSLARRPSSQLTFFPAGLQAPCLYRWPGGRPARSQRPARLLFFLFTAPRPHPGWSGLVRRPRPRRSPLSARRPPSIPAGPLTRSGQRSLLRILLRILSSLRALGTEPGDGARPGGRALAARINTNDPYAGSPTKTLLRLLLPRSDQVRLTFRLATRRPKAPCAARSP